MEVSSVKYKARMFLELARIKMSSNSYELLLKVVGVTYPPHQESKKFADCIATFTLSSARLELLNEFSEFSLRNGVNDEIYVHILKFFESEFRALDLKEELVSEALCMIGDT